MFKTHVIIFQSHEESKIMIFLSSHHSPLALFIVFSLGWCLGCYKNKLKFKLLAMIAYPNNFFKVKVGEADHYIKLHVTHNRELEL